MRDTWLLLPALCVASAILSVAGEKAKSSVDSEIKVETASGEAGAGSAERVVKAEPDAWEMAKMIVSGQESYMKYEVKVPSEDGSGGTKKEDSAAKAGTTAPGEKTDSVQKNATSSPSGTNATEDEIEDTTPYEDDPRHRERQHMEDFVAITEKIYVIKRNFNLKRIERCESAQRLRQLSETNYEYLLRTRMYKEATVLMSMKVFFTISKTGVHKDYNAVKYAHGMNEPSVERKLMYISPEKTCAILVEDLQKGRKGCQLVQPESAIDRGVPLECNKIYEARCGKKSLIVYESVCKTLPDSVPHEEL
uniref:Putative salivary lipocalin n=1 Tax=Rhipicephalus pulchellus TaxID=72859 RepID=L7LTP2_RHIPC